MGRTDDVHGAGLIFKACDILDLVGHEPGRLRVRDLAERSGLAKSSVYRIVAALEARGLLRNDRRSQRLSLGFRFLDLAQNVWSSPDLPVVAAAELRRLSELTGETAYLAALSGAEVVVLARALGAHEDSSMSDLGVSRPLYCTSQGKAVLAAIPAAQADALIDQIAFSPLTEHTIVSAEQLRHQLKIIRRRGFSVDDQELMLRSRCVGAPVLDAHGECLGAISVTGPFFRMTLERIEQLGPELIAAARRIGEGLAACPQTPDPRGAQGIRAIGDVSFQIVSPFCSSKERRLYWADRLAPAVHAMDFDGGTRLIARLSHPIDALSMAPEGGLDVMCEDGWRRLSPDGEEIAPLRALPSRVTAMRLGSDGARWVACVGEGATQIGVLSAMRPFRAVWTAPGDIHDLAISADGGEVYACDGARGVIYQFRKGRGAPHVLARIPRGAGEPRGLTLDAEARLWVALYDGWSVARLDEFGEIERVIGLPVPRPTGLAFGDRGKGTLFIATARLGLPRDIIENAPLSGRMLAVDAEAGGGQKA